MRLAATGRHRARRARWGRRRRVANGGQTTPDQQSEQQHGLRGVLLETTGLVLLVLLAAVLIRTFLVAPFFIPSQSMEDTLKVGDRVLVDRVSYHLHPIRRGDIVVFNGLDSFTPEVHTAPPSNPFAGAVRRVAAAVGIAPPGERDFIKRVIGIPGDTVACAGPGQPVTVNGVPLDESSYLYPGDAPSLSRFSVTVPKGRLWVMGDHRSLSADSRSHLGDPGGGTVPQDKVIGRAFAVVWPLGHLAALRTPGTFDQPRLQQSGAKGSSALGVAVLPLLAAPALRRPLGVTG